MEDLLSLEQAAKKMGVHIATMRGWVRTGKLPAYKLGGRFKRVSWSAVLAAMEGSNGEAEKAAAKVPEDEGGPGVAS